VAIALGYYELFEGKDGKSRQRTTLGFHAFRLSIAEYLPGEPRVPRDHQALGEAEWTNRCFGSSSCA
jgi:hypothetical protein